MTSKNRKTKRDPIPKHFKSIEEAADFWDEHDLTDYWDLTKEVQMEVDIQRRVFLTALEPTLAQQLTAKRTNKAYPPKPSSMSGSKKK